MSIAEKIQSNSESLYVNGLLATTGRKVATNLAKSLNILHDKITRELTNTHESSILSNLTELARETFDNRPLYASLDDTRLNKIYASNIEGLDLGHDGSTNKITQGLQMVTTMLSAGGINLPIDIKPYISKWLSPETYKTKSDIAWDIIQRLVSIFNIERVLADAHYATRTLLPLLVKHGIKFLMKIPRNRKVIINGKYDQLQRLLRLRRNERIRCLTGIYDNEAYFFYVVKVENGSTVYLISSDYIDKSELQKLYKIRWKIELFHRTAKQMLGLSDCQSISLQKQIRHCLFVAYAYCLAELRRDRFNMESVDDVLNDFRDIKFNSTIYRKFSSGEHFNGYA